MEEGTNSFKISETAAKDKEPISPTFLHRYYQHIMDNTQLSSVKVERAAKFLLLPEISRLVGDHTKAIFLLSKGLTHEEVIEAFTHYHQKQEEKMSGAPQLILRNISQSESNPRNTVQVKYSNDSHRGLSLFMNLCQRVIVLAGISTACYYVYQKWRTDRARENKTKKEHKRIEDELNIIKSELQKISVELKTQQAAGKTNADLLKEINSLKAILVSRQYFEEKQNSKLSLPSWQLNSAVGSSKATDCNINCNDSIKQTGVLQAENKDNTSITTNISVMPEPKIQPVDEKNLIQSNQEKQINGENEENIANGDLPAETFQKPKKSVVKNRNSKSKNNENGNKITLK